MIIATCGRTARMRSTWAARSFDWAPTTAVLVSSTGRPTAAASSRAMTAPGVSSGSSAPRPAAPESPSTASRSEVPRAAASPGREVAAVGVRRDRAARPDGPARQRRLDHDDADRGTGEGRADPEEPAAALGRGDRDAPHPLVADRRDGDRGHAPMIPYAAHTSPRRSGGRPGDARATRGHRTPPTGRPAARGREQQHGSREQQHGPRCQALTRVALSRARAARPWPRCAGRGTREARRARRGGSPARG